MRCGLLLAVLLAGCPPTPPPTSADPRTPPVEHPTSDCTRPDRCTEGYTGFVERAKAHARPVAREELWSAMWAIIDGAASPAEQVPAGSTLPAELLLAANAAWLLQEARLHPTVPTDCGTTLWGPAEQHRLCFDDPWVGRFEALLLLPGTDGPYSAVVAHPGHAESAAVHRDRRHALELLRAEHVVAILEPRAFAGDEVEHAVADELLGAGHTLVALRMYELTVLGRYVASRDDVDASRMGLLGHSGGSDPVNLLAFVDPGWKAAVIDQEGWYMARIDDGGRLSSEASPALWRWHELMRTEASIVPRRVLDYGFPDGAAAFVRFFGERLAPTAPAAPAAPPGGGGAAPG
jgi:hypothetical protein